MLILLILTFLVVCSSAIFSFLVWRDIHKYVLALELSASQMTNASAELKHTTDAAMKKDETRLVFVNPYVRNNSKYK